MKHTKEIHNFPDKSFPIIVGRSTNILSLPDFDFHMYHPEVELQYVFSGKCAYFIRNRLYYLHRNSLLIIYSNEPHRYVRVGNPKVDKIGIIFSPSLFNYVTPYLKKFVDFVCSRKNAHAHLVSFPSEVETEIQVPLSSLIMNWQDKTHDYKEFVIHKLIYLFMLIKKFALFRDRKNKNINVYQEKYLKNSIDYIDKHYSEDENISLSHVASAVHISPNYLSGLFTKLTGLSFKTHLLSKRISEAKSILEKDSDKKVISVALETGFDDVSNFNRSFKKLVGVTPSSYRKFCIHNRK